MNASLETVRPVTVTSFTHDSPAPKVDSERVIPKQFPLALREQQWPVEQPEPGRGRLRPRLKQPHSRQYPMA